MSIMHHNIPPTTYLLQSWMINSILDKNEKAIVELMAAQQSLASGFKFGYISLFSPSFIFAEVFSQLYT